MKPIFLIPRGHEGLPMIYQDMELILLHVAMKDKRYTNYFRECKNYKILDNSAYELKNALNEEDLMEYARIMKVQEVVAPDDMLQCKKTIDRTQAFLQNNKGVIKRYKYKVMGVVHGKNETQWMKCFKWMNNNKGIDVIGVSKADIWWRHEDKVYGRFYQVWGVTDIVKKPIHLFGATDIRDYFLEWPSYVRSMDTKNLLKIVTDQRGWDANLTKGELERYMNLMDIISKHLKWGEAN
jgi:hypothetical protein